MRWLYLREYDRILCLLVLYFPRYRTVHIKHDKNTDINIDERCRLPQKTMKY